MTKALAILATVALVLLGRWWRDALSDARLAAVDDIDWLQEFYVVGEQGPEMVVLPRGSYITPCEWRN
jgi:hypothetical protein